MTSGIPDTIPRSENKSIDMKFVRRRYTTRPGVPTEVSGKHDQKYTLESFPECTGVSNVMTEVRVFQAAEPE